MDEDSFIEAASRVFGAGMPPMAGRIWAYLAICEPPQQTAAMIADRLHASRGSVSGMARLLEQVGLIRRHTRPGDRREYFDIPPDALHRLMEVAARSVSARTERWRRPGSPSSPTVRPNRRRGCATSVTCTASSKTSGRRSSRAGTTRSLRARTDAAVGRIGMRKEVTA